MTYATFYNQILTELLVGRFQDGISQLVGMLDGVSQDASSVALASTTLRNHDLWNVLKQDPLCATSEAQADQGALLCDLICNQAVSGEISSTGQRLFGVTSGLTLARALRERRQSTQDRLQRAWQSGQRICVIGNGQFRALEALAGYDLSNITLIAPTLETGSHLSQKFSGAVVLLEEQSVPFPTNIAADSPKFDLICAADLPDQSDIDFLRALVVASQSYLSETGKIVFASFLPHHLGTGWRTVCLKWALNCFDERDLVTLGQKVGLHAKIYRDASNSVVWSEFSKTTNSYSWGAYDYGH
jgi:hypothetical protein